MGSPLDVSIEDRDLGLALRRFRRCDRVLLRSFGEIDAVVARSLIARLLGLAFLRQLPDHGLLFPRCRSIQTVGMRVPIDVAFLAWPLAGDPECARVVDVYESVRPFRIATLPRRAWPEEHRRSAIAALELAAGGARDHGLAPGAELGVAPAASI